MIKEIFKILLIFITYTVLGIKEIVIPTTIKKLLQIILKLRDCMFLIIMTRIRPWWGITGLFNRSIIKFQEVIPYDL